MSIYILSDKSSEYFRGYDNVVNCWQNGVISPLPLRIIITNKYLSNVDTRDTRRWPRNRRILHINQKRHERRRNRSDYAYLFLERKSNCLKKGFFFFFFSSTLSTRFELIYHTYLARTCDFIEVSIRFLLFPFLDRSLTVKVCQLAGNWLPPSNQSVHRLIVLNQIQFAIVFTLISSDEHCFFI